MTDAQIKRLPIPPKTQKRPDTYTDYDALQLHVFNTGRKSWLFNSVGRSVGRTASA